MAIGNMYKKFGEVRACIGSSEDTIADRQAHIHTDRHTNMLIAILRSPTRGGVIMR